MVSSYAYSTTHRDMQIHNTAEPDSCTGAAPPPGARRFTVSYHSACPGGVRAWSVNYHQPAIPPVVYKLGAATRSRRMAASSSSSFLASSASPSSRAAARTCVERRAPW